jgi:hypothetical protein
VSQACCEERSVAWELRLRWSGNTKRDPADASTGCCATRYTKAGDAGMDTIFAGVTGVERIGRMLRVRASAVVSRGLVAGLRKAFRAVIGSPVGQMHSADQAQAGRIEALTIELDGTVRISALIEDRVAAVKAGSKVYPGISVKITGDGRVDEVSLVDRDFAKLSKGAGAADVVLARFYSINRNGGSISKMTPLQRALGKYYGADDEVKRAVQELLARKIEPDAGDAAKRSQAFSDWQMLYRAGRRPFVNDPRFGTVAK